MKPHTYLLALFPILMPCSAHRQPEAASNQYVVKLAAGMAGTLFDNTVEHVRSILGPDNQLLRTYNFGDFKGFAFEAPTAIMELIRVLPGIDYMEPNWVHYTQEQSNPYSASDPTGYALDRISHRANANNAGRQLQYVYDEPAGKGTYIYVLDGGVKTSHPDFGGRARTTVNFAPDNVLLNHAPRSDIDYSDHGTPAAGLAAGTLYGVAREATILSVRVFNDNGSTSSADLIAGIDWATNDALNANNTAGSVINASFGGLDNSPEQNAIGDATREAIRNNMFVAVSAGNSRINAADFVPANVAEACTVGGTNSTDGEYYYSNYGTVIDIWAPGSDITAPSSNPRQLANGNYKQVYGTSFSAPLVAGVAASLKSLGGRYRNFTPQGLCGYMQQIGSHNYLKLYQFDGYYAGVNILLFDRPPA